MSEQEPSQEAAEDSDTSGITLKLFPHHYVPAGALWDWKNNVPLSTAVAPKGAEMDNDVEGLDDLCPMCGKCTVVSRLCNAFGCEDGWIDVYEDDPMWHDPGDMVACEECDGRGYYIWCTNCGYDMTATRPQPAKEQP